MNLLGTNITAPVVPFTTDDIYASHIDIYGKGGYRCLENLDERDSIVELRRTNLMLVAVKNNNYLNESTKGYAIYQLILDNPLNDLSDSDIMNNDNWVEFSVNGNGDMWVFPVPESSVSKGIKGQRSFDDDFLYLCIEDNLWKRIAMDYFVWSGSATSGFDSTSRFDLNDGAVPVWFGDDWTNEILVKKVYPINTYGTDGTSALITGIAIEYTDGLQDIINIISDDNNQWILPSPPSSISPGTKGDKSYSSGYLYICVEDNLWKRINLDFFDSFDSESTSGFLWDLQNGVLPTWDNGWIYKPMVENIEYNSGYLDITYSNSTSSSFNLNKTLDDLTDVELINPKIDDVLAYNGVNWYNTTLDILANTSGETMYQYLEDLRDVYIENPQDDDILLLNGTTWFNRPLHDVLNKNVYSAIDNVEIIGDGTNSFNNINLYSTSCVGHTILEPVQLNVGDSFKSKIVGYYNVSNILVFDIDVMIGNETLFSVSDVTINYPKTNCLLCLNYDFNVRNVGNTGKIIGQGRIDMCVGEVSNMVSVQLVRLDNLTINTNIANELKCLITVNDDFVGNIIITNAYIEK